MAHARVLVIDDEPQIRRAVGRALSARDFEVALAADGESGLDQIAIDQPDLLILDLNLPGIDGFEVCDQVRRTSDIPILILSVRDEEADTVRALDLGADDYLTKPFGIDELMARVRALLRRGRVSPEPAALRFVTDGVTMDIDDHVVEREGAAVKLTKTEWALLEALATRPGKLLTHGWLLENVWGPGYVEDVDVLRVFVSQLRKKIEPDRSNPTVILTDPGIGYRWTLPPASAENEG